MAFGFSWVSKLNINYEIAECIRFSGNESRKKNNQFFIVKKWSKNQFQIDWITKIHLKWTKTKIECWAQIMINSDFFAIKVYIFIFKISHWMKIRAIIFVHCTLHTHIHLKISLHTSILIKIIDVVFCSLYVYSSNEMSIRMMHFNHQTETAARF